MISSCRESLFEDSRDQIVFDCSEFVKRLAFPKVVPKAVSIREWLHFLRSYADEGEGTVTLGKRVAFPARVLNPTSREKVNALIRSKISALRQSDRHSTEGSRYI